MLLCVIRGVDALAAPDEIMVYTDEMNAPGVFGLEQHVNYAIQGTRTPEYPGQMPSHHVMQFTPEFSYGLSKDIEVGLYVPTAFTPDGNSFINALRLHMKYIAPRPESETVFYGLNVEISRESLRISRSISTMELRPIIGYRDAKWLVSFNPILSMGLAANVSHQLQFEPALKLTHYVTDGVQGGVEYYGTYGSLSQLLPASQQGHTVYAVFDAEARGFDINFGIGRGFVNASDSWVVKTIFALPIM